MNEGVEEGMGGKERRKNHGGRERNGCNILCELVLLRDTVLKPPYTLSEQPTELHHTYLDTVGRRVVVAHKQNLVEQHIQDFEVRERRMSWLCSWWALFEGSLTHLWTMHSPYPPPPLPSSLSTPPPSPHTATLHI